MNYLLIENKGELDINSLILMGGSTKTTDDTKRGKYGSGNKFAIAMLLRKEIDFKIFSGEKEISITTKENNFRDTIFQQIIIDGKETSLTTNMGNDWKEEWYALREFCQNSIDEGESNIINSTDIIQGKEGKTRIYVELTEDIQKVVDNWNQYFSFDREDLLEENKIGKIFSNNNTSDNLVLFTKGIKSSNKEMLSLFHYDSDFEINESRVISNDYSANLTIANILAACKSKDVIHTLLSQASKEDNAYHEAHIWSSFCIDSLNPVWKETIGNKRLIVSQLAGWYTDEQAKYDCYIVTNDLAKRIKKAFPEIIVHGLNNDGESTCIKTEVVLDARKQFLLKECNKFFEETQYSVDFPIKIVRFEDGDKLGLAEDETIYLSEKLFDMGKREIAVCIMEENEHLITKYKDCSRALQQHLFNKWITVMEDKSGYFL